MKKYYIFKKLLLIASSMIILSGCSINVNINKPKEETTKETTQETTQATVQQTASNNTASNTAPIANKSIPVVNNTQSVPQQHQKVVTNNTVVQDVINRNFNYVIASSQLATQGHHTYYPSNVIDGDTTTAWVEGVTGTGEGEWIELQSEYYQPIHKIGICNGYRENDKVYRENGRILQAELEFSDGRYIPISFDTINADGFTYFNIGEITTSFVRIRLTSCTPGTKYDDVCISEVRIY